MKLMLRRIAGRALVLAGTVALRAGDPLLTMLDPYFRIQSALSDDKTEGVKADAAAIAMRRQGDGRVRARRLRRRPMRWPARPTWSPRARRSAS